MKPTVIFANIILFAAIITGTYFYISDGSLLTKSITSALFAITGLINYMYIKSKKSAKTETSYALRLLAGLFFSMLGDIFLNLNFVLGAAFFAAGHICYIIAYSKIRPLSGVDLALSGIIFMGSGSFLLFSGVVVFSSELLKYSCLIYALIISMMLGKALCNFVQKRIFFTSVVALGSMLFFFSDLMLVFDTFTNVGFESSTLCLSTYYPAQWLLAFSMLASPDSKDKTI